jgi:hypothetical protein
MGARASESDRARYSQMSRVENFRPIQEVRGQSSSVQRSNAALNAARAERACPRGWAHRAQELPARWPTYSDAPRRSDMSYPRHSPQQPRKVPAVTRCDENVLPPGSVPAGGISPQKPRFYVSGCDSGANSLRPKGSSNARRSNLPCSAIRVKASPIHA